MTVCLASICNIAHDRPPIIVGASDRMITVRDIEYEPDQTKLIVMASHTVALMAGEMPLHADAVRKAAERVKQKQPGILVSEIADIYADEFHSYQRRYAEDTILRPLNLTFDTFLSKQRSMSRDFVLTTTEKLQRLAIASEAIIAGIDPTGARLFRILPGAGAVDCGIECFAAIGSGAWHAESQFMVAGFEKQWSAARTLLLTYVAKHHAEANAGVGHKTDLFYITPSAGVRQVLPAEMKELEQIYKKQQQRVKNAEAASYKAIQEYIEQLARADEEKLKAQQAPPPVIEGES